MKVDLFFKVKSAVKRIICYDIMNMYVNSILKLRKNVKYISSLREE